MGTLFLPILFMIVCKSWKRKALQFPGKRETYC
ncbi:unnamed protein product [Linum tenue]|uniref:Uncharacterized protein n=1 Tax=Linum tenue TaxID=586396 RepID=A0AAV0KMQ6_9ROSI|nr:unnamed protein product [Linum tenue]